MEKDSDFNNIIANISPTQLKYVSDLSGTVLIDGEICGMMGIVKLWNGVGEVWLKPGTRARKHKFTFIRTVRKYLNILMDVRKIHRLEAKCITLNEKHNKFLKVIGFKKESVIPQYGPNKQDFTLYSILR